jgi:secretion/DNA translocation related CpaE-like protein
MPDSRQIVALSAREDIRATVLKLGALAGTAVEPVVASSGVRGVWRSARMVVVGSDLAEALAAAGLPRRADVIVVAIEAPDASLWRAVVELGATQLLTLPADERALVELMSDAVEGTTAGGSTIAVIGGCGGAGASTLAAALALTAARAGPTVLIDGDRYGGGLDVLLGAEQRPGARWPDLAATRGRLRAGALTESLVHIDGMAVLSWDRAAAVELSADAAAAVVAAAIRGFRYVVVDLPRRLDPASTVLASAADLVIMVVPASVRATAAAAAVAAQVLSHCAQLRLVVRDARSGQLTVGEIGGALALAVAATVDSEAAVQAAAERGEPPLRRPRGSLHDACRALLAAATDLEAAA